jgi:nucleoside phosphorylase
MNNILLVTVTKVETTAVLDLFAKSTGYSFQRRSINGKTYYDLGTITGNNIFMVQSEMGTIGPGSSLITTKNAIEALHPSAIIMIGIAFGINPQKQNIGEILVSRQLVNYEQQKVTDDVIVPRWDKVTVSNKILELFRSGSLDWQGPKVHFGIVLSGDKLVASQKFRDDLLKHEPETIGGEMEGAGLYAAASESKVDWILVKAICDWGDGNKSDDYQVRKSVITHTLTG